MRHLPVLALTALLLTPGAAAAEWLSLRTDHFLVIGNTSGGQLRDVGFRLEQFREVVGQLNPAALRDESAPPVVVLVFRDSRTYEPFMPRRNGAVVRVGGFFQSGQDVNYITLNVQAGQGAFHVVFHEYSHLLLRGVFADAPVWFNEGLAEYYSTVEVIDSGRRANIGKPIARHVGLLRERRLPFAEFFAIDRNSRAYTADVIERDILYAQAWAILHHAFHGPPKRRDQLLAFVGKIANGGATETSFREAYGITVRDLEREIQIYVQNQVYRYGSHELSDRVVTRIEPESTTISDAEAEAWLADLLLHMDRSEEAAARAKAALAGKPDSDLAHAVLGTLYARAGRTAEGMDHLHQAVTAGPGNERVQFAYANALIASGNRDDETLAQASRSLERAIELRPGYRDAKLQLAYTRLATGDYSGARELLTPLVRAEPTNHVGALYLAEALLRLDDADGARELIESVLARSANTAERDRARELLTTSPRFRRVE
jgi:tetratricopeptide (TPR) repeat protein